MKTSRTLLGRRACPLCKFEHAHVKRSDGKLAYLHCPSCGWNAPCRNLEQERHLLAGMRPEGGGAPGHVPQSLPPAERPIVVAPPVVVPAPPPPVVAPAAPRRPAGLWDQLMGITREGDAS